MVAKVELRLWESGRWWTHWFRLLGDRFGTQFRFLGDTSSGR